MSVNIYSEKENLYASLNGNHLVYRPVFLYIKFLKEGYINLIWRLAKDRFGGKNKQK